MTNLDATVLDYELFIFDLDGTLISSRALMICALRHCQSLAGLATDDLPLEQFFSLMGCPLEQILRDIGLPASLAEEYRRYSKEHLDAIRPHVGVIDTVRHLARIGKLTAINTGKDRARTLDILDAFGLSDRFDAVVASDDVARGKPHPDSLDVILRHLHVPPEAAVMVGDSRMDMECARRAGVDGALALWDVETTEDGLAGRPKWRFETVQDLQRAVGYDPTAR